MPVYVTSYTYQIMIDYWPTFDIGAKWQRYTRNEMIKWINANRTVDLKSNNFWWSKTSVSWLWSVRLYTRYLQGPTWESLTERVPRVIVFSEVVEHGHRHKSYEWLWVVPLQCLPVLSTKWSGNLHNKGRNEK